MRPLFIILAAAAVGCTEGGRPLVILQNQVPEAGCRFSASQGGDSLTFGRIDVNAAGGYLFAPLVQNNAESLEANPGARLALIEGADVELSGFTADFPIDDPAFQEQTQFTTSFSGAIEPDGGLATFSFILVTKEFLEDFVRPSIDPGQLLTISARIVIFGQMGGSSVESVPFNYPIQLCEGCMMVDVGACADLPDDFEALPGGECNTLQDVPLECCDDFTVCPATPPTA